MSSCESNYVEARNYPPSKFSHVDKFKARKQKCLGSHPMILMCLKGFWMNKMNIGNNWI